MKKIDMKLKGFLSPVFRKPSRYKGLTTEDICCKTHNIRENPHSAFDTTLTDDKPDDEPFNFLQLPAEIRNRIYELVLENGSCKGQGRLSQCAHHPPHIHLIPRNQYSSLSEEMPIHSLLTVNKQIRYELRGLYASALEFIIQPRVRVDISLFKPWLLSNRPTRIHLSYPLSFDHKGNSVMPNGSELVPAPKSVKSSVSELVPTTKSASRPLIVQHAILMVATFDLSGPRTKVSVAIDDTPMLSKKTRERWARWLTLSMNWPLRQSGVPTTNLNERLEEVLKVFEDEVFEWFVRWGEYHK